MVLSLCFFVSFLALFMIIRQGSHFFMILLSFEILTLGLYFISLSGVFMFMIFSSFFLCLVFLVFSVCEASLGLGLLVSSMRSVGFDSLAGSMVLKY